MHNTKHNNINNGDASIWNPLALNQAANDSQYPTKCPGAYSPPPHP
jgi:hypothetical protein